MKNRFRTTAALSLALATSTPVPNAFARADTKIEAQAIVKHGLETDPQSMKLAKNIFEDAGINAQEESIERVAACLHKYRSVLEIEQKIVYTIESIVLDTNSEKAAVAATDCISRFEKTPNEAKKISMHLESVASDTKSGKAIVAVATCISNYEKDPSVSEKIADSLESIAREIYVGNIEAAERTEIKAHGFMAFIKKNVRGVEFGDSRAGVGKAVVDAATCISKFEDTKTAERIAKALEATGEFLGSRAKSVIDSSNCILRYKKTPELAVEIAEELGDYAMPFYSEHRQRSVSDEAKWLSSDVVFDCIAAFEKADKTRRKDIVHFMSTFTTAEEVAEFSKHGEAFLDSLKKKFNIEHFSRYPYSVLKDMITERKGGSIAIMCYAKKDPNGAFNEDWVHIKELSKHYNIKIFEAGKSSEATDFLKRLADEYGKADLLLIAGHGKPTAVLFDSFGPFYRTFDMSDSSFLATIKQVLNPKADILLFSCSTGDPTSSKTIAAWISAGTDAYGVQAPDIDISVNNIRWKTDENGRLRPIVSYVDFEHGDGRRMTYSHGSLIKGATEMTMKEAYELRQRKRDEELVKELMDSERH